MISVQQLCKRFPLAGGGEVVAVDQLSFTVHAGEVYGLAGAEPGQLSAEKTTPEPPPQAPRPRRTARAEEPEPAPKLAPLAPEPAVQLGLF